MEVKYIRYDLTDAELFLQPTDIDFLVTNGGEAPAKDVFRAGQLEGYSRDALKRAKGKRVRFAGQNREVIDGPVRCRFQAISLPLSSNAPVTWSNAGGR